MVGTKSEISQRLLQAGYYGNVVGGFFSLSFVPVNLHGGAAPGERRAQQNVIEPHPPPAMERNKT
ncbi:MAG: hypothetical protein DMG09_13295 [Acidobacteria bacterium]|nr:MAG: hypothetical protein DMG09_13295 [Acidobacteriota bacterium]